MVCNRYPSESDGLVGEVTPALIKNKKFDNSNTYTIKDQNLTLQNSANTAIQAQFDLSNLPPGTTLIDLNAINFTKNVTYSELMNLISSSALKKGTIYTITDFNTVHYIVDANGLQYSTIITGINEPLTVTATSTSTITTLAYSALYPQDVIYYDPYPANWSDDLSFFNFNTSTIVPGFKGVIYFRHDTLLDNYVGYDFRNVKFRRWNTNCPVWDSSVSTSKGNFVEYSGFVYMANANNISQIQIDTITLTGTSGTAHISLAGGLTKTATFNIDLPTTASDFVTANSAAYLAQGIVITSNSADIIFTANVSGTPFTSPAITNTSGNLNGNVVNTQVNITPETPSGTANFWIQLLDLSLTVYWNNNPTGTNNIPSGALFVDIKTFAEGSGSATYDLSVRSTHIEPFKDDNTDFDSTGSLLSNSVFFLQDNNYYTVYSNQIGAEFYYNTIGNSFYYNTIGNNSLSNTIVNRFHTNTIGSNFYYNTIGNNFSGNTIGNAFVFNTIGNNFNGNTVGNTFSGSTIGNGFNSNTIGNDFFNNTIGNGFNYNTTLDLIASVDFTSATYVYITYSKTIQTRADGSARLSYIDNTDTLIIVNATA
jgi:hypothetical protein